MGLSSIAGIDLAKEFLCKAGGNPELALQMIITLRLQRSPENESLSPEGAELRNADNYLFSYWMVSKGLFVNQKITWQIFASGGIASWQAYHVYLNLKYRWKGVTDTDPPSFMAMAAGYEGINDAASGGSICGCKK